MTLQGRPLTSEQPGSIAHLKNGLMQKPHLLLRGSSLPSGYRHRFSETCDTTYKTGRSLTRSLLSSEMDQRCLQELTTLLHTWPQRQLRPKNPALAGEQCSLIHLSQLSAHTKFRIARRSNRKTKRDRPEAQSSELSYLGHLQLQVQY